MQQRHLETRSAEAPTCPKCNRTYAAPARFCIYDGTPLAGSQEKPFQCATCGTAYGPEVRYCPKDGGNLVRSAQSTYYPSDILDPLALLDGYPKASLGNRFLAAVLDGLITLGFTLPALTCFLMAEYRVDNFTNDSGTPSLFILAVFLYALPLGYSLVKDGLAGGQSWGKRAVGLMVVDLESNTPCDKGKSFFRNFISALLSIIPFVGWLIEPVCVLASDAGRKLGDKAARTQVIEKLYFNY